MTPPKPNTTNSELRELQAKYGQTINLGVIAVPIPVHEIEALIASKVEEAEIRTAQFYRGTLSDHDLRELDRQTLNTWRMYEEKLSALQSREQDKV